MRLGTGTRTVITGAGRGLGRAIATELIARGGIVGVNGHECTDGGALPIEGGHALPFDVRDPEQVARAFQQFGERFGGIDLLINNAGIGGRPQFFVRATKKTIDDIIQTNLLGAIYCTQSALPHFKLAGAGKIVFISSASVAVPMAGVTVYAASKAGLESFAASLDCEYRKKSITSLVVRLGAIRTEMTKHLEGVIPNMLSIDEAVGHIIRLIEEERPEVIQQVGCENITGLLK